MSRAHPHRIVISRTDRIGDVVLTLPLCALLRRAMPQAKVIFLARDYTRAVVESSPYVDEVLSWDSVARADGSTQATLLESVDADAILHVFPRREIATAAKRARIPRRIGTSHRIFHWTTCNEIVSVGRKRSEQHEAQLNLSLARGLLGQSDWPLGELASLTELRPRAVPPAWIADQLTPDRFNLVLHPRSGGSAIEWPLAHFGTLVNGLDQQRVRVFISGSTAEAPELRDWIASLPGGVVDLSGRLSLEELIAVLHMADGFVGGSTGPLHIAAGVGIRALGLFPSRRPMHPGRWAPLGRRSEVLAAAMSCDDCGRSVCTCMSTISAEMVAERIRAWTAGA